MVFKKIKAVWILVFLNLFLLSFASGAVLAWKDSYCKDCSLPWGGSIHSDVGITAYFTNSVACGSTCASETRTCNNGTLSGSYGSSSCSVGTCVYCGDGSCNNGETCSTCPGDCGSCCTNYQITWTGYHHWNVCADYSPPPSCPRFDDNWEDSHTCSAGHTLSNIKLVNQVVNHGSCIPCVDSWAYYYFKGDCICS